MPDEPKSSSLGVMTYAQVYGPYAFGVASLLLIWFAIVKPELGRNRLDFDSHQQVMATMAERDLSQREMANSMEKTAQTLTLTAKILERTVERLDGSRTSSPSSD